MILVPEIRGTIATGSVPALCTNKTKIELQIKPYAEGRSGVVWYCKSVSRSNATRTQDHNLLLIPSSSNLRKPGFLRLILENPDFCG